MRQVRLLAWIIAISIAATGCNSSSAQSNAAAEPLSEPTAPSVKSDGRKPEEVVQMLMEAMLAHDQAKADSMLTAKARLANALKADTPPSVRFKVGDVEVIDRDNAHVAAAWFYPNEDGSEYRVMTLWMLRNEPEGFRVYGNIMIVPELAKYDGGKVAFDFEDPEQFAATESRVLALLEKERGASAEPSVAESPHVASPPALR
jgi:hypothetical protein